jgi:hypothetical protein
MPMITRPGRPSLHVRVHDHTDPWRDAPWLVLQHGYGRSEVFWRSWIHTSHASIGLLARICAVLANHRLISILIRKSMWKPFSMIWSR